MPPSLANITAANRSHQVLTRRLRGGVEPSGIAEPVDRRLLSALLLQRQPQVVHQAPGVRLRLELVSATESHTVSRSARGLAPSSPRITPSSTLKQVINCT